MINRHWGQFSPYSLAATVLLHALYARNERMKSGWMNIAPCLSHFGLLAFGDFCRGLKTRLVFSTLRFDAGQLARVMGHYLDAGIEHFCGIGV